MKSLFIIIFLFATTIVTNGQTNNITMNNNANKTEQQWADELDPEKYQVLRQCGTEAPFTGKYVK